MTRPSDPKSVSGKTTAPERRVPLVVVGAGPAGVAAATAAAHAGVPVLLLDEHPLDPELMAMDVPLYFGQRMSAAVRDRGVMLERVVRANPGLEAAIEAGVEVELGISVWGAFQPGPVLQELGGPCLGVADQTRSWLIGYDRLIVAAGARDLGLAFRGWEKAGTMGAAGALALLARYQAFAARRMVVLGSGPLGLAVAALARTRGIEVAAIVEVGPALRCDAGRAGAPRAGRHALLSAPRRRRRRSARATSWRASGSPPSTRISGPSPGARSTSRATPRVSPSASCRRSSCSSSSGAGSRFHSERGGFVPEVDATQRTSVPEVYAAGDVTGVDERAVASPDRAHAEGRRAGLAAAAALGAIAPDRTGGAPPGDAGTGGAERSARPRLLAPVDPRDGCGRRRRDPRLPVRGGDAQRAGRRPAAALSRRRLADHARPEHRRA